MLEIAKTIQEDSRIPRTLEELVDLPGIGRKSANVILREMGEPAVGIIVDLHVLRVSPRLDIAQGTDPKKIEKQLMEKTDQKDWGEVGMAISFLGRETCRPSHPHHDECVMKPVCAYAKTQGNSDTVIKKLPTQKSVAKKPNVKKVETKKKK